MGKPERYAELVARLAGAAPESKYIRGKGMPPPGRIPAMLAARRAMVDAPYKQKYEGLDLPDGSWMPTNRRVNVSPVARDGSGLDYADEAFLRMRTQDLLENQHQVQGFFDPEFNLVAYPDASTAPSALDALGIRRHEVMHAYNAAAMQGGEGLPFWSRVVANTPRPIARPLDELIAQRAGGRAFQDIPWDYYAKRYAEENQLGASRVARVMGATTRAAQFTAENPVTVGVAAGGLGFMGYGLAQPGAIGAGARMQGEPSARQQR